MIQTTACYTIKVAPTEEAAPALETTRTATSDVASKAMELLRDSPFASVRRVQCRFQEGVLILSGQVPSFYLKQVALESLRNLKHVEQIDNRLSVPE